MGHPVLKVVDEWTNILEKGGVIDVIYCDFKKAFDTVPHKRLIDVLRHYGIKDQVLAWVSDFLSERKFQVIVNGSKSEIFDVLSGVPQGSVLGPLLFIIYINLMIEIAGNAEMYLYADDLKLFKRIASEVEVEELQHSLDKLYDWTQYSLLKFHPNKCATMRIMSKSNKISNKTYYNLDETKLKNVMQEQDLGIIFDCNLSFDEHIYKKVKKANALAGMIRRTFFFLDKETFKLLFTSVVRPHLEYGAPVWNPHQKNLICMIENVQRRASKLIPGMSNHTYEERLKCLNLPTLQYRRYRGDMIEMYKISHGLYDQRAIGNFIEFQSNSQNLRRHAFTIYKENCKKDVRKFAFKCRVTNAWNNLPTKIVNAPTLNCFKNRLDKLWKENDVMYNPELDLHEITSARNTRYKK